MFATWNIECEFISWHTTNSHIFPISPTYVAVYNVHPIILDGSQVLIVFHGNDLEMPSHLIPLRVEGKRGRIPKIERGQVLDVFCITSLS